MLQTTLNPGFQLTYVVVVVSSQAFLRGGRESNFNFIFVYRIAVCRRFCKIVMVLFFWPTSKM